MARGNPFSQGHKKLGGRKKGVRNKLTLDAKDLIAKFCGQEELIEKLEMLFNSKDERTVLDIVKTLMAYQYGKPVQQLVGSEEVPPVRIDVSGIPMSHERVS
jgi:hypothetical protein